MTSALNSAGVAPPTTLLQTHANIGTVHPVGLDPYLCHVPPPRSHVDRLIDERSAQLVVVDPQGAAVGTATVDQRTLAVLVCGQVQSPAENFLAGQALVEVADDQQVFRCRCRGNAQGNDGGQTGGAAVERGRGLLWHILILVTGGRVLRFTLIFEPLCRKLGGSGGIPPQ